MGYCATCDTHHKELLKTVYGDFICADCWDDYITSDEGRLEYLVGICQGDYPMSDFDSDFLGEVAVSWKKHANKTILSEYKIAAITLNAYNKGLL